VLYCVAQRRGRGKVEDSVYYDINDETVTPRQHIVRALGGPICNALILPFALLFRRLARQGSMARDVANAAVGMNAFLCTASLLPIPGIDGGPALKWALVERGYALIGSRMRLLCPSCKGIDEKGYW